MSSLDSSIPQRSWREQVQGFFFTKEVPYGLALTRICLPLVLFVMMFRRWFYARELYSTDGATSQLGVGYAGYGNYLPEFGPTIAVALCTILMVALLAAMVGWCTRTSLIVANVIFTYFCQLDSITTMTKYTVIATHVLLLLTVSPCGQLWSVDAWLERRRRATLGLPEAAPPLFDCWPRRLIQILIAVVYFGAGITKLHTPTFFSGDQLQYWMQTHVNYRHPIGEVLSIYPIFLVASAYMVVTWELVFPFLCWRGWQRPVVLAFGCAFHVMTCITLGLFFFPLVCYCTYFSYLSEAEYRAIGQKLALWWPRGRKLIEPISAIGSRLPVLGQWQSRAALAGIVATLCVIGVEAEAQMDLYQMNGPQGPLPLKEIDPEVARIMISPTAPMRDIDKFYAVDMGTIYCAGLILDRRSDFYPGQTIQVQCSLLPPHEDMVIECYFVDEMNHILERMQTIALREHPRAQFTYALGDTEPGEYAMVIRHGGREVLRRKVRVLPAK